MTDDLRDRRTYDVLRLLRRHEPVGSVRLTEQLRERGYSITERTVRLTLAELDDRGLTVKDGGKGRRLTDEGRAELDRGGVHGRSDHVNERLAELTSRVDYDPAEDSGSVVVGSVTVPRSERDELDRVIARIDASPLGPVRLAVDDAGDADGAVRVTAPSSVTINGVLLAAGIDADLEALGTVEYRTDPEAEPDDDTGVVDAADHGGSIVRYTDAIGNERATFDVASVLIDAGRTDVGAALAGRTGLVVADYLEFPLSQVDRARELAVGTRNRLGGVIHVRRPRSPGPSPWGPSGWTFASLTQVGVAECLIARCTELGIATDHETLAGVRPCESLEAVER